MTKAEKAKATEAKELIPFTNSQLPVLEFSFDEEKQALTTELDKYKNIVVTVETLKEDKKLAQDLSAKGKAYNKQRIEKIKEISKPIEAFKSKIDELVSLCNESAEIIKKQVSVFEKETLAKIKKLIAKTLTEMRETSNIAEEFRVVGIVEPLVKLGALTAKGALVKGTKDKLAAIVAEELALQQKIDYRLLQLESEGYKADLESPLRRINVEAFLFDDDEGYAASLKKIIESELERQNERKQPEPEPVAQETIKQEEVAQVAQLEDNPNYNPNLINQNKTLTNTIMSSGVGVGHGVSHIPDNTTQNAPNNEYNAYANQMMQEQSQHQQEPSIQLKEGNVMCTAIATFKVSVPHQVTEEMVQEKLIKMLDDAGVKSLDNIEVTKHA